MDWSQEQWQGLSPNERVACAKRLARELPLGFSFLRVQRFQCGESHQDVALFQKDAATFALIPGGRVRLGYDAERPWQPHPDELASWQDTVQEFGYPRDIHDYIARVTLRVRHVELAPVLIETTARELGWEPVDPDDPAAREILCESRRSDLNAMVYRGGMMIRVMRTSNGDLLAQRSVAVTHAELTRQWAAAGFRFPTSDEWEYACGAGAGTLFRWGDHAPWNHYPVDGGGEHRQPNAFGMFIAENPYHCELVAEPGVTRGGDGGVLICGGVGYFISWLTLATAYFEQASCHYDAQASIQSGYTIGRRVLELR